MKFNIQSQAEWEALQKRITITATKEDMKNVTGWNDKPWTPPMPKNLVPESEWWKYENTV